MNQKERQKNDGLLAIVFCLLLFANGGINYNKTGNISFLFLEIAGTILLIYTSINYIKLKQANRKTKPKKKSRKQPITPFDKKFKRNYIKTNKNHAYKKPVPDLKSEYIQSAWDEIRKI